MSTPKKTVFKNKVDGKYRYTLSDSPIQLVNTAVSHCISTLDIASFQKLSDRKIIELKSLEYSALLKTTDVAVLRLWFKKIDWPYADSGVFAEDDILDNFFYLASFQEEFADLEQYTVIETHIGEIEKIQTFSDQIEESIKNLEKYFKNINFKN